PIAFAMPTGAGGFAIELIETIARPRFGGACCFRSIAIFLKQPKLFGPEKSGPKSLKQLKSISSGGNLRLVHDENLDRNRPRPA
ncbi:MAG: hypothetical protein WCF66_01220, partial [Pseudolabrys sp.]